jgi:hypothetical protein
MVVIEGRSNNVEAAIGILGKSGDQNLLQEREHFVTRFFSVSDRHLINRSVWNLKLSEVGQAFAVSAVETIPLKSTHGLACS